MKIKHVLVTVGLTAMCGIGALIGFTHAKEMKMAKADDDNAMFSVVIDLGDAVGYTDFHKPEVHYYDSSTSTIDKYADLHLLNGTYYTANLTYNSSSQTIDHIQFLFKQTADVDKWSNSIELTPTTSYVYHFAFPGTWTGDDWNVTMDTTWYGTPRIRGNDISDQNFTANVPANTYKVSNLSLNPGKTYQVFFGKWGYGAFRQSSIDSYLCEYSVNSFEVQMAGTYDIIAYNDYSDGGIFEIKMHNVDNRYIYYVLENNTPTTDYIYTWGEGEQFGAWPGTKITEIFGVEEITDGGRLCFQNTTPKLIYKIPVVVGYPTGDSYFKFNKWEGDKSETDTRPINHMNAYWWTGDANGLAGSALSFLEQAEEIRKSAADSSICHVSKANAESLVSTYSSMGTYMQETYVDNTHTTTHKKDGSSGEELVSYHDIMLELARIADPSSGGSSRVTGRALLMNNATIAIVVSISIISFAALTTMLVIKKRKQKNS